MFGKAKEDDSNIGAKVPGRSMLKSKRNFKAGSSTGTGGRAVGKPKIQSVQEYVESDSEDSLGDDYEGPIVGVKVASAIAGDDSDDEGLD